MTYFLSARSLQLLKGVHNNLVEVVKLAIEITEVDFVVLEGLRSIARQKQLVAQGVSKTMHSRHLTGHAVDLGAYVDGSVRWDLSLYRKIAQAMKRAAREKHIQIEWGGDWQTFKDNPHFQLPWSAFPEKKSR